MNISEHDASRIARFLAKGIFSKTNNKDINITIGEYTCIGIERRGHKYYLYIKYHDEVKKEDIFSGFNENIPLDELAQHIKLLIDRSETIKDIELKMEKTPMLPAEAMSTPDIMTTSNPEPEPSIPVANDHVQEIQRTENESAAVNEQLASTGLENHTNVYSDSSTTPLTSPSLTESTTLIDPPAVTTEKTENAMAETMATFEETQLDDKEDDEDESIYEQLEGQPVVPDESEPQSNDDENEELEEFEMDTTALVNDNTRIEASVGVKGMMPARVDNKKLPEMSYLANVMGTDTEIKQKLYKAIDQLITRDKESAIEFYIRMLYRMLPLFNNDVSSAATGTGLDQRDFMLSVYERPLFSK